MSIGTIDIAVSALARWLGGSMIGSKAFDVALDIAGKTIGIQVSSREPIDKRLANIETARQSLASALSAIDELQAEAELSAAKVEELKAELGAVAAEHEKAQGNLLTAQELAKLDADEVKRLMGVPTAKTVWLERGISFFIGVLASVVASVIWTLLT